MVYDELECDDFEKYLKIRIGEILNEEYRIVQKLGKGVFANVVKATNLVSKKECAIKILRNDDITLRSGENEYKILEKLNKADKYDTKHIVRIESYFLHKGHLCIVFELHEMNLRDAIKVYGVGGGLGIDHVR